jgi:DNA-binding transcriptional ArsR family regulator
MSSSRPQDRAQRPVDEELRDAARAVRDRAGISKNDLKISLGTLGAKRVLGLEYREEGQKNRSRFLVATETALIESFKRREIWGRDPDELRRLFEKAQREPIEERAPKKKTKPRVAESDDQSDDDWQEGFAAVPYPVIDKLLHAMHPGLLRTYIALLRFESYTDRTMYPGQDRLAELVGLSDRQVRKYLHALEDAGLITITRQGYFKGHENMPNLYRHVPLTRDNWRDILSKLEAWSLPGMSKADRKRLSRTDRNR